MAAIGNSVEKPRVRHDTFQQPQNDDDDFNFDIGDRNGTGTASSLHARNDLSRHTFNTSQPLVNQPFDEALEVSDSDSSLQIEAHTNLQPTTSSPRSQQQLQKPQQTQPQDQQQLLYSNDSARKQSQQASELKNFGSHYEQQLRQPSAGSAGRPESAKQSIQQAADRVLDYDDRESGNDDIQSDSPAFAAKLYNPADYAHINVSSEIRELFDYIGRYQPQDIILDTKLIPFIPDYIPAIGDIDAFLKVPRPDGQNDNLGIVVLDEPAAVQSDPTVLDLRLRVLSKQSVTKPVTINSIDHADKNPKKVTKWIQSIEDVHRQKPPSVINYSKPMPDIEMLMQAWPMEFEQVLKDMDLPQGDLDISTEEMARIVCAIMDIPVHDGRVIESLHVLFTLYCEFRSNQHLANI